MKYFSLYDLLKELKFDKSESLEQLLNLPSILNHPEYSELKRFILTQNKETRIFNSWIEQHKTLKELLVSGTTSDFFNDLYKWNQHALFKKFKLYVSPFFEELIKRKNDSQISSEWARIFSFFVLLDDESRIRLEQTLYQNINSIITKKLSETNEKIDALELHQILLFLLSEDCIAIHNSLSRASHNLKVSFIEQILQLFYHPRCTAKLAHWMILRLEIMAMNSEQNQSLASIKSKIKSGEIQFLNQQREKQPIVRSRILGSIFSILSFGILLMYLYKKEFTVVAQNFKEASSLSFFSIKERKEIDSIIKSMTITIIDSANTDYYSSGTSVSIQNPIINELAKDIYNELELDMTNHFMRVYDTCSSLSNSKLSQEKINQTKSLDKIAAKKEVEFKNDSEFSFLIIAWEESRQGKVFSGIISKNSILKLKVLNNMKLVILPGNDYGLIPQKNKSNFKHLTNHFCSIDFNYEFALQQIYSLNSSNSRKTKILLDGKLGEVINITDTEGILSN